MKNKTKFLAVVSVLFLLTGCGEHEHTFSKEWSKDESYHWHDSTCEHKIKHNKSEHTFGDVEIVDGVETQTCTVCGYVSEYNPNKVIHSDGFSNVTDFPSTLEIHTERQKTYLSYTGDYSTMAGSDYPDGNATISDPNMFDLSWEFDDDASVTKYSVTIGQTETLYDGFEIMGTKSQSIKLYNLFLGTNYYRINAYLEDGSKVGGDVYSLNVDGTAPRNLYVGKNMTNCRDVGGRTTVSGGKVKQGLLIRTCGSGYNMDSVYIDSEGTTILKDQLKVKTEINLNDSTSYNVNVPGTNVIDTFMDYGGNAKHHFSRNTENVKNVFEVLAKESCYPVFFHCRIGTDRTGLIGILVNGLIGVSLNEIYQDYLFSNFGKIGKKRYIGSQAGEDDIQKYMQEINAMPGANFQEKTYNTLLTIGVPRATLDKVISILVEGNLPDNNKGQIVVEAKDMQLSGTTLVTEDKSSGVARSTPASCATLSANASMTATFTNEVAGNKEIYIYVGNSDSSTSKKLNASISATIDGNPITIPATTFKDAGMGNCSNRVNYYYVKIGDVSNLSAGEHSIKVTGIANNMSLGNIAVL